MLDGTFRSICSPFIQGITVRSSEHTCLPFMLSPFWFKRALSYLSVGLIDSNAHILLTRWNTYEECIPLSALLGDQKRRQCQRMQNIATALEELRRGCSWASKDDENPLIGESFKKWCHGKQTPLMCFFSEKVMRRSASLCRIFTWPVVFQLPGRSSYLQNKFFWTSPFELLTASTWNLAWREGPAQVSAAIQVVKELNTAWAGNGFSSEPHPESLCNCFQRSSELFNTECKDTISNVKRFTFTDNLSNVYLGNSTVTQVVLFWNVTQ